MHTDNCEHHGLGGLLSVAASGGEGRGAPVVALLWTQHTPIVTTMDSVCVYVVVILTQPLLYPLGSHALCFYSHSTPSAMFLSLTGCLYFLVLQLRATCASLYLHRNSTWNPDG